MTMGNGQPELKRPRVTAAPPLPPLQPARPQKHRRPSSGPSPHADAFHQQPPPPLPPTQLSPNGGPQDVLMKREPVEEVQYRPASTGSAVEPNAAPIHSEARYQLHLPPFEMAQHPRSQSFQNAPSYIPQRPGLSNEQQQQPPYSSGGGGGGGGGGSNGRLDYGTLGGLPPQRLDYVSYPTPISTTQKRKAQRAAQACDSCRALKAKCDEGRPYCTSCKEKGTVCVYRDPPPKQQDRNAAEIIDALNEMEKRNLEAISEMEKRIRSDFRNELNDVRDDIARLFPPRYFKDEHDNSRHAPNYQIPPQSFASPHTSRRPSGPPPLMLATTSFETTTSLDESTYSSSTAQPPRSAVAADVVDSVPDDDLEEDGPPVTPGQPSIPVNHTTGAARLLLNRAIRDLAQGVIKSSKIKNVNWPMLQEERRGMIRLFGRGEGTDRFPGHNRKALTNSSEGATPTPSYAGSDHGSPGKDWGHLGGLSPPIESAQRGPINHEGIPHFKPSVVRELVQSYLDNMNNMHPILVPAKLNILVENFLRSINNIPAKSKPLIPGESVHAGFVLPSRTSDSTATNKRKRSSPGQGEAYELPPSAPDFKPGLPFRSISTAIILLVLALGDICQHTDKIPDVVAVNDPESSLGSSSNNWSANPVSPTSLQSSPSLVALPGLPSLANGDKSQPWGRRISVESSSFQGWTTSGTRPKNLDVIPGMKYFAFATDILGNQASGNSLQHVHAQVLASLYYGQLGRPLESAGHLWVGCRSLQTILRTKLDRFKKLKEIHGAVPPAKDNQLIIAFWTCLQLESDIVAELPVPHSGILTYEEDMPGLNLQAAVEVDQFDPWVIKSYAAQLSMRRHLNQLHNMFYKPVNDSEYSSILSSRRPPPFKTIDASLQNLEDIKSSLPKMHWTEEDPPAEDILRARFRAKYYGAKVITYRPFLMLVLEHSASQTAKQRAVQDNNPRPSDFAGEQYKREVGGVPHVDEEATQIGELSEQMVNYAREGIKALIKSTTAFHGLGPPEEKRLIVTNIWGTAHAQWGNLLTLQAASIDPILGPLVDKQLLMDLYTKTMGFLKLVAQPSSALYLDCKILEHVAKEIGLI